MRSVLFEMCLNKFLFFYKSFFFLSFSLTMKTLSIVTTILFSFTTIGAILISVETSMNYAIKTSWDNQTVNHQPVKFSLSYQQNTDNLDCRIEAPFFNDPAAPQNGVKGKPFPKLWDYEGNFFQINKKHNLFLCFYFF